MTPCYLYVCVSAAASSAVRGGGRFGGGAEGAGGEGGCRCHVVVQEEEVNSGSGPATCLPPDGLAAGWPAHPPLHPPRSLRTEYVTATSPSVRVCVGLRVRQTRSQSERTPLLGRTAMTPTVPC